MLSQDYTHTKRVCQDFEIKIFRWISWFVCSEWYIIAIAFEIFILKYMN